MEISPGNVSWTLSPPTIEAGQTYYTLKRKPVLPSETGGTPEPHAMLRMWTARAARADDACVVCSQGPVTKQPEILYPTCAERTPRFERCLQDRGAVCKYLSQMPLYPKRGGGTDSAREL